MRFTNQTALVTGGRSGIGRAIARRLRSEGARVFTAQRNPDSEGEYVLADFRETESAQRVIDAVVEKTGRLDILINNAGQMKEALIENCSLEQWQETLTVNLTIPFLLIKYALPHLKKAGVICNIGSIEGLGANPQHAAYCASKSGLHGLTRAVAVDHGSDGIRCNTVAPGWIETPLNRDFIDQQTDPDRFTEALAEIHPVGEVGQPENVAALVSFLVSQDAAFITGQVYTVDGGRMTQLSLPR